MEFAFMTEPQVGGSYDRLRRLAQWAEAAGFDVFSRSDHYLNGTKSAPTTDALISLAALARDTSAIRLNVLVAPATFRHPAVAAKSAATIDEISGGRFEIGVGTGWMESEHEAFGFHFPPWNERFARLEESLAYLRAAFGRSDGGFAGDYYRLDDIVVRPAPTGPLPIVVGGTGPRRTPTLAGRYADELNMAPSTVDGLVARREVMRGAAAEAGRDPDSIRLSLIGYPIIGADRADYHDRMASAAQARGRSVDEFTAALDRRGVPHGTVDEVGERMAAYAAAGVTRYYVQVVAALDDIDTDDAARVLRLLKG